LIRGELRVDLPFQINLWIQDLDWGWLYLQRCNNRRRGRLWGSECIWPGGSCTSWRGPAGCPRHRCDTCGLRKDTTLSSIKSADSTCDHNFVLVYTFRVTIWCTYIFTITFWTQNDWRKWLRE